MLTNPSGTVCWPGGARGLHTSPDCDRTCLCCYCDSHCFVPPAMETRFKTAVGDVTLPPVPAQNHSREIDFRCDTSAAVGVEERRQAGVSACHHGPLDFAPCGLGSSRLKEPGPALDSKRIPEGWRILVPAFAR
jgi:hypothetical protein